MRQPARFCAMLGLVLVMFEASVADEPQPPADTGVLDVTLPAGASISVSGNEFGDQRHFEMKPLDPKWLYPYEVVARLRGGETVQRKVLLKGGWSVHLTLSPPDSSRPELVLQTGHISSVSSVAFSPDGRRALSGSHDKTAILWHTETGVSSSAPFAGTPIVCGRWRSAPTDAAASPGRTTTPRSSGMPRAGSSSAPFAGTLIL